MAAREESFGGALKRCATKGTHNPFSNKKQVPRLAVAGAPTALGMIFLGSRQFAGEGARATRRGNKKRGLEGRPRFGYSI